MKEKSKITMDTTDSRSVYNKMRKLHLENTGKIRCAWCPYHRVENEERKFYGTSRFWTPNIGDERCRYPNWKLVSKNRKQWMKKPLRKEIKSSKWFEDYLIINF